MDELKKSVSRLFKQRFELGMWDPPSIQPYLTIPPSAVDSSENNNLALEVPINETAPLLFRRNSSYLLFPKRLPDRV